MFYIKEITCEELLMQLKPEGDKVGVALYPDFLVQVPDEE